MYARFGTFHLKAVRRLILCIAVPLLVGFLASRLSGNQQQFYSQLVRPVLSPPGWVFGVVWPVLYILMGISAYLVRFSGADCALVRRSMCVYYLQLGVNALWSVVFFRFQLFGAAFYVLLILLALIVITSVFSYDVSPVASWLYIPYVMWVSFAGYLNYMVWILNA